MLTGGGSPLLAAARARCSVTLIFPAISPAYCFTLAESLRANGYAQLGDDGMKGRLHLLFALGHDGFVPSELSLPIKILRNYLAKCKLDA